MNASPEVASAGRRRRHEEQPARRRERPGEDVRADLRPPDRDAARPRRLLVVAERVHVDSERRAAEDEPDRDHDADEDEAPRRQRVGEDLRVGERDRAARLRQDLDREPVVDRERRQRDEDRLKPSVGDQHAVDRARRRLRSRARSGSRRACFPVPSCMCEATMVLESAITPPTERSRPRVRTTTVWPTATNTSGSELLISDVHSKLPGRRCRSELKRHDVDDRASRRGSAARAARAPTGSASAASGSGCDRRRR